jgi:hypothetical protein
MAGASPGRAVLCFVQRDLRPGSRRAEGPAAAARTVWDQDGGSGAVPAGLLVGAVVPGNGEAGNDRCVAAADDQGCSAGSWRIISDVITSCRLW